MQTLKELWGCKFTFPDNLTFKKCVCNFLDSNHVLLQSKWWYDGSILEPGMSFESIGLVLPICQQLSRLWWCKAWKSFIATDLLKGVNIKADTSIRYVRWLFDIHWPLKNIHFDIKPKTAQSWWSASFWQTWNILSIAPNCCNTNSNGKPGWHFVLNGNETDCPYGEKKASVAT